VKANHATQAPKKRKTEEKQNRALDEIGRSGYEDGAYKTSRRGAAFAPALSVQMDELLSPAANR
jgi:uncharacterized protein with FMN-binding domain